MSSQENEIYNLELNNSMLIPNKLNFGSNLNTRITRVPGGWLYTQILVHSEGVSLSSSFVPFNSEFSEDYDENGRKLGNREKE